MRISAYELRFNFVLGLNAVESYYRMLCVVINTLSGYSPIFMMVCALTGHGGFYSFHISRGAVFLKSNTPIRAYLLYPVPPNFRVFVYPRGPELFSKQ